MFLGGKSVESEEEDLVKPVGESGIGLLLLFDDFLDLSPEWLIPIVGVGI